MTDIFADFHEGVVLAERIDEHIAVVTLNRPAARNAINGEVTRALDAIREITEAQDDIWAVVLTGAGDRVFSSGADLREVGEGELDNLYTDAGGFAGFAQARRQKIWIAAVNGFALAGGFELALACDMIVASEDAQFGLPEVGVGLLAAAGGAYRLPRRIPRAIAIEMITTTCRLSAARALEFGLVNCMIDREQVVEKGIELARQVCQNAPLAIRESMAMVRRATDEDEQQLHRLSMEAQTRLQQTDDFAEGPRAFIEKRPPVWRGR